MMKALEERLGTSYPYSQMGNLNDFGTTAVLSRYPFADTDVLDLQADRPAVVVRTKIHEKEITFVSVHLLAYGLQWVKLRDIPATAMKRTLDQNRQVKRLLEEFNNEKGIIILGCDYNSKETSSSYRMLDGRMDNSAHTVGWVWNRSEFANAHPDVTLQHIDYVWY